MGTSTSTARLEDQKNKQTHKLKVQIQNDGKIVVGLKARLQGPGNRM